MHYNNEFENNEIAHEKISYMKISNYVMKYIKQNNLKDNDKIQSENQLAEKFGVSRNVVRTAFSHLRSQGYIYSIKGRGFFVQKAMKPLIFKHSSEIGFSEILGKSSSEYDNKLISWTKQKAKAFEITKFGLDENENVYHLKTLRIIKDIKFAICYSSIPEKYVKNLESHFENYQSINKIFMDNYGYNHPSCDSITIEAAIPTPEDIKYLNNAENVPILNVACTFSTESTGVLEYFIIHARSDIFKFNMNFNE